MGAVAPIPPVVMNAAAPKGAPRRLLKKRFSRKPNLPRRAPRGALRRGAIVLSHFYTNFHSSGVNPLVEFMLRVAQYEADIDDSEKWIQERIKNSELA
jgi:hypothetical protein